MCLTLGRRPARVQRNLRHTKPIELVEKTRFIDLPFDLIIEVFQHLEPVDLLYLSWTTKALRGFLFNRSRARHVWKVAIANYPGLPSCPDYISEPAYTHLAFVPVCHGCFDPCNTIEWELRMRCCHKCLRKMAVRQHKPRDDKDETLKMACSVCLPISRTHLEFSGHDMVVVSVKSTLRHRRSDWEAVLRRAKTRPPIENFLSTENKLWKPIIQHAPLYRQWEFQRLQELAPQLKAVRDKRVDDIKENLKALGWTDDIYYSADFLELRGVSNPEPLTPTEWSKFFPDIVASLPKVRLARMAEIYRARLEDFESLLGHVARRTYNFKVHPRNIDIFLQPAVRDVLEGNINTNVDYDTMSQTLKPILPGVMRQWSDDAVNELASLGRQQLGPESDVDQRNLVFWCTICEREKFANFPVHLEFDTALSHKHLYAKHDTIGKDMKRKYMRMQASRIYEEVGKEVFESHPRKLSALRVHKNASHDKDSLVKALGGTVYILPVRPSIRCKRNSD